MPSVTFKGAHGAVRDQCIGIVVFFICKDLTF